MRLEWHQRSTQKYLYVECNYTLFLLGSEQRDLGEELPLFCPPPSTWGLLGFTSTFLGPKQRWDRWPGPQTLRWDISPGACRRVRPSSSSWRVQTGENKLSKPWSHLSLFIKLKGTRKTFFPSKQKTQKTSLGLKIKVPSPNSSSLLKANPLLQNKMLLLEWN